jgi:hypothetical protein
MSELDDIAAGATKRLNTHGYAFEQAVIHRCVQLHRHGLSQWRFVISECPVDLHGEPHHIDFVLYDAGKAAVIVVECKRVDPARARACFLKRTYTRAGEPSGAQRPIVSVIQWDRDRPRGLFERPMQLALETPFHLCMQLKTGGRTERPNFHDSLDPLLAKVRNFARANNRTVSGCIRNLLATEATKASRRESR